jgi:hypothetical protein
MKKLQRFMYILFLLLLYIIGAIFVLFGFAFAATTDDITERIIWIIITFIGVIMAVATSKWIIWMRKHPNALRIPRRKHGNDSTVLRKSRCHKVNYTIPENHKHTKELYNQANQELEPGSIERTVQDPATTVEISHKLSDSNFDNLLPSAVSVLFQHNSVSVSMLQTQLNVGYARAARLIDEMYQIGIVSEYAGSLPRKLLITPQQWNVLYKSLCNKETSTTGSYATNNTPTEYESRIIQDEENWRREQYGLSPAEYELKKVDYMEGHAFEHWCASLLMQNGFSSVEVTPGSNDQGVDILAQKDGIKYAIQCKCYSADLGNTPVQEVNTGKAIYRCQVGVVMTNRHFTKGAQTAADATGILLWDREKLIDMVKAAP